MAPNLAEYIEAGKSLSPDEREIAALALQSVDDAEQAEIDAAWEAEVQRRLDDLVSGRVKSVSGRETRAMGRALLAERRR